MQIINQSSFYEYELKCVKEKKIYLTLLTQYETTDLTKVAI